MTANAPNTGRLDPGARSLPRPRRLCQAFQLDALRSMCVDMATPLPDGRTGDILTILFKFARDVILRVRLRPSSVHKNCHSDGEELLQ